jgi:hypothetical protein
LADEVEDVRSAPLLRDLPVLDAHDIDKRHADLPGVASPRNSPSCVARIVERNATRSPSAITARLTSSFEAEP